MCTGADTGVELVRAGLAVLTAADVPGLSDAQVRAEVLDLLACLNQLTGALLDRVAAFDRRGLSQVDAQRASSTWLVDFGRMSKGAALRWLVQARSLARLPALAGGVRRGTVSAEQVAKVADLVRRIGVDQVREYDEILAELCASAGPGEVEKACARIWALVDPDGAEPDPLEDFDRREITFSRLGAMMHIRGRLDPEGAAALQTAVDALMRPPTPDDQRTAAQRRADAIVDLARGALAAGALPEVGGERPQIGILVTPEMLLSGPAAPPDARDHTDPNGAATASADRADGDPALHHEATHRTTTDREATHHTTNRHASHHITTDRAGRGQPRPAATSGGAADPLTRAGVPPRPEQPWLSWVGEVSCQLAQRLACDGTVWRLVLDPRTGLPLDVGRKIRIVPWWIRKAIRARDRTCRWPGCDVPSEWTDAHHLIPWWRGGETSAAQAISLCRYHHTLLHEGRWTLRLDPTTGEVHVRRPDGRPYELGPSRPWVSPARQRPPTSVTAAGDP